MASGGLDTGLSHPEVVEVMQELPIDVALARNVGTSVAATLPDPKGPPAREEVRSLRNDIARRVRALVVELNEPNAEVVAGRESGEDGEANDRAV
jgi:hypothetical protein